VGRRNLSSFVTPRIGPALLRRFAALGPGGGLEAEGRIAAVAAEMGFEVEDFLRGLFSRAVREAGRLADLELAPALWARLQPYSPTQRRAIEGACTEHGSPGVMAGCARLARLGENPAYPEALDTSGRAVGPASPARPGGPSP